MKDSMSKKTQAGFTMIEMLVVIGIIAVLSGALFVGVDRVRKTAQRSKAQEIVSNTATALGIIFQNEMNWPKILVNNNNGQLDARTSHVFVRHNLLGLSYDTTSYIPNNPDRRTIKLSGVDRCGIVDPWAAAVLKRVVSTTEGDGLSLPVSTGKTVKDHVLWYAVDTDGDGVTEVNMAGGGSVKVRAPACMWCAGADGELGTYGQRSKAAADDVYSWTRAQEVK